MENLRIEYVPIDSITPYENNAKLHPQEQIEQIKRSIKDNGMNDPIGIWHDQVVEGHGRLLACKELGMTEVPVIRLDHMTDEQRRSYALIHNKLTMNSDFDLDVLREELDRITQDMSVYGFDLSTIEIEDIDQFVDTPEEPICKELGEANNYIVLEFFTEQEWEDAQIIFGLQMVQTSDKNPNIRRHGIGRVIPGAEVMERLAGGKDDEN